MYVITLDLFKGSGPTDNNRSIDYVEQINIKISYSDNKNYRRRLVQCSVQVS